MKEHHPLIGRRVRIDQNSSHYPNRFGRIVDLFANDPNRPLVDIDAYKSAPAKQRICIPLANLVLLPC